MNIDRLKEITLDQQNAFNAKKDLISRDIDLEEYISTKQIVIISGVRRCGKSSLLFLIKEAMNLSEEDFLYFNFDDERIIPHIEILEQLHELHLKLYAKDPIMFLDEIQVIPGWEKFVNRMHERSTKIYLTGSNGNLLSSEISTSLTGRNRKIELFPFSFSEFLRLRGHRCDLDRLSSKSKALLTREFDTFFENGGFPLVDKENDIELINSYFQDILYRDIVARYKLTQVDEMKQIGLYFASNVGKLFSYSTLQKITGIKSLSSIKNYLYYYSQSFLFFYLKKFDYSVKKQIFNPQKVYAVDQGIATRIGFNFSQNKGWILENIVFLELKRRGLDLYYHYRKKECDFIIKKGLEVTTAIQVCYLIDSTNKTREYDGLIEALADYNLSYGLLLTYNQEFTHEINSFKIHVLPVWKWLLNAEKQ